MSTDKSAKESKPSARDPLPKTTEKGKIELTEDDLRRASGGGGVPASPSTTKFPDPIAREPTRNQQR